MSQAKGVRLWLRPAREGRKSTWLILDGGKQKSTGCAGRDLEGAQQALEAYLRALHKPVKAGGRDLAQIPVSDVVAIYSAEVAPKHARPHETNRRLSFINRYFGQMCLIDVTRGSCLAYARHRGAPQAARRELTDFRSAVNHYFRDEAIAPTVHFELPPNSSPRERWLTHAEAAKLLITAWRRSQPMPKGGKRHVARHIARFTLVGLYTGTRASAICAAAIRPTIGRGYVDLDRGVFYRRPPGTAEGMKRKPPVRLPGKLLNHLRRWARLGLCEHSIVEWKGQPVKSIGKGFRQVAKAAGLPDVSPHVLRHTAISWSLQSGAKPFDVSEYFGVSEKVIKTTYAHHNPEHQQEITTRMDRRKLLPQKRSSANV